MIVLMSFVCSCQRSNDELIEDFEAENLVGWNSTGDLDLKPYQTSLLPAVVVGYEGKGVLNTGHNYELKSSWEK